MKKANNRVRAMSLGVLTAAMAGTMLLGAGAASAAEIQNSTVRTQGGDISCSVSTRNVKTGPGEYRMTATLSACNKPLRDGMRLQIGDERWYSKLYLDPSARITNRTAVFEDRSYGYLGADEYFYIDDMNVDINLPFL